MKYLFTLLLVLALAVPAISATQTTSQETDKTQKQKGDRAPKGGFRGPISGAKADTVAKALELVNEAPVVLTGSLVSKDVAEKDIYIFKDDTGEVKVKIERKVFGGKDVTPETKIRIGGRVEKEDGKDIVIDVKNLEIMQ